MNAATDSIKIFLDAISAFLVAISIFLAFLQMKKTLEWNKKKTAEEALTQIVSGDLLTNLDRLAKEIGWSVLTDSKTYKEVVGTLPPAKQRQLDQCLTTIFRHLETTAIKIEHDVYDESICFDYLFSLVISLYRQCEEFINRQRLARKEPRLYEHVELYAKKWQHELEMGKRH